MGGTKTPILFSGGIFSQWKHLQILLQVNYEASDQHQFEVVRWQGFYLDPTMGRDSRWVI